MTDPKAAADPRIAYFDRLAVNWDNQEPSQQTMVSRMTENVELLGIRPGCALLEVGCGTGKTTGFLAGLAAPGRVKAIDFSPEMVRTAAAKGIAADFACLDACRDDLGEGLYDLVLCFHCFPHLRDQVGALRRFERAMKPDGRLVVMHIASSSHINGLHARLAGAVNGDHLPVGEQWQPLLAASALRQTRLIDREGLYFMEAVKS